MLSHKISLPHTRCLAVGPPPCAEGVKNLWKTRAPKLWWHTHTHNPQKCCLSLILFSREASNQSGSQIMIGRSHSITSQTHSYDREHRTQYLGSNTTLSGDWIARDWWKIRVYKSRKSLSIPFYLLIGSYTNSLDFIAFFKVCWTQPYPSRFGWLGKPRLVRAHAIVQEASNCGSIALVAFFFTHHP